MATLKWLIDGGNYYYFKDAPAHTTGVSLNKNSIQLTTAGQTEQLTATIIPAGALEQGVTWSSSDDSVATVSNTGLVTCVTPGECTITVTTVYGGYTANCSVSIFPYTPTANTLIYFPFISDVDDYSGNGYTLDVSGTQETIGRRFNTPVHINEVQTPKCYFVSFWIKNYNKGTGGSNIENQTGLNIYGGMNYQPYAYYGTSMGNQIQIFTSSSWASQSKEADLTLNTWYHLAFGYGNGAAVCWINGVKYTITTGSVYDPPIGTENTEFIINRSTTKWDVAFSDFIAETELWTDQQVTDYFNANKSKYGL